MHAVKRIANRLNASAAQSTFYRPDESVNNVEHIDCIWSVLNLNLILELIVVSMLIYGYC